MRMWRGVARKLQSFNILTIPSNSHACCKNKFVYIVQRSVFLSQCRMLLLHRVNMSLSTCYVSQPSEFACLYKSGHAVEINIWLADSTRDRLHEMKRSKALQHWSKYVSAIIIVFGSYMRK